MVTNRHYGVCEEWPVSYESRSAQDAQRHYGRSYCDYLEANALRLRDYWLGHGEPERAAQMMTRTLGEALRGNDGD